MKHAFRQSEDVSQDSAAELPKLIKQKIYFETVCLFGISLFSFLDQQFDYQAYVESLIKCDHPFGGDWKQYPENMLRYFSSERIAWSLSMMLHLSNQRFRDASVAKDFKEVLKELITGYIEQSQSDAMHLPSMKQPKDEEKATEEFHTAAATG